MRTLTFILSAGLIALHSLAVAETAPANLEQGQDIQEAGPVLLKNKSSFALDRNGRSPFWPIGWKPAPAAAKGTGQHVSALSPSAFVVTSITVEASGRYAIINGKVINEGQIFGLQVGKQVHQITVKAIRDGQVVLSEQDQEISVPLRRR